MARPSKNPQALRRFRLNLRLTASERARLDLAAAKAGITPSEYARRQILDGRVIVREARDLSAGSFVQIVRIGTNLNQIARRLNAGGKQAPAELASLCRKVESILGREVGGDGAESRR